MKTSNHTVHRDFTIETLNRKNQHSFECYALLFSYSFRIKGYMSNLGPHLRHNQHHNLLLMQEQPCSQFGLHLHDKQHTSRDFSKYWLSYDSLISLYGLTTHLFIVFTLGKTLNIGAQKWLQIHAYHWLQIS